MKGRGWLAAGAVIIGLAASRAFKPDKIGGAGLPALDGSKAASLESCPTAACLTVVVAPWCPYCRASTGLIQALRGHLQARGVATRVVVAQDREDRLREYAAEFGSDTLLDPDGRVKTEGVPHFIVSDAGGRVLNRTSGAPADLPPRLDDAFLARVAAELGVP